MNTRRGSWKKTWSRNQFVIKNWTFPLPWTNQKLPKVPNRSRPRKSRKKSKKIQNNGIDNFLNSCVKKFQFLSPRKVFNRAFFNDFTVTRHKSFTENVNWKLLKSTKAIRRVGANPAIWKNQQEFITPHLKAPSCSNRKFHFFFNFSLPSILNIVLF